MFLVSGASGISLAANIAFIILAFAFGFGPAEVMWAYFIEAIVIGFFHFLRIAHGTIRSEKRYLADTLFTAGLFAMHFFAVQLAAFALLIILAPFPVPLERIPLPLIGGFVFFLGHAVAFLSDTKAGKSGRAEKMRMSLAAYPRIAPVYAALLAAGVLQAFIKIDAAILLALMALKAALDILAEGRGKSIYKPEMQEKGG
ncbi:MAG: DUF6498-containing protein [Candidatus Micrarchaeota archaeon]